MVKDEENQAPRAVNLFSYLSREMGLDDTDTEIDHEQEMNNGIDQ